MQIIMSNWVELKMATPMEVRQKHRAVMKFLGAEGETPANIHKRLQNVYKGDSLEYING